MYGLNEPDNMIEYDKNLTVLTGYFLCDYVGIPNGSTTIPSLYYKYNTYRLLYGGS